MRWICRLIALVACLLSQPAGAEVYRCVDGGKTVYSDKPCGGDAARVTIPDAPLPAPGAANSRREANAGRIEVGMTKEQVERAWGRPAQMSAKKDADGITELWTYDRNGDTTEVFIRNGTVARIGSSRPAAPSAAPVDEPLLPTAADLEEQERAAKADERRFIREGMTEDTVLMRIGPPAIRKIVSPVWGIGTCWIYPPAGSDPQTQTTICFNRDGGHVISVDRVLEF